MNRLVLPAFVLFSLSVLLAQEKPKEQPRVLYSVPLVLSQAEKSKVLLRGFKLDTLTEVTAKEATLKLLSKGKKPGPNNYPAEKLGDSEAVFEVEFPKTFQGDTLELLSTKTALFKLQIERTPTVAEKEPNDSFKQAQELTAPCIVTALINREKDVDVYKIVGKAGQLLNVKVQAVKFGAPTDTLLTLYDANQRTLAIVDDVKGHPDPVLNFKFPGDGVYFLSVIEAHDVGGALFPYRLVIK
jgi:hypothetical protein